MEKQSFCRVEKKYVIKKSDQKKLLPIIKAEMQPDNYFKSEIFNIYFDDDDYNMITQSIDWVDFKEKIRARSYKGYDRVFIEIKTKIRGDDENLGHKRRIMVTRKEFKEFINQDASLGNIINHKNVTRSELQVAEEIDYLVKYLNLKPRILVSYKRTSYRNQDGLRITFDENLRYRTKDFRFNKQKDDKIFFEDTQSVIMELKSQDSFPLWLVRELSKLKIYPRQFSKIGSIYQKIRKENDV